MAKCSNKNDWKERLNVVYSTNPDFHYKTEETPEAETLAPDRQKLRVRKETKGRGGKVVTVVGGFTGSEEDLKELGRRLKTQCGVGGSVKEGEIIVQGDFRERIVELLLKEGYKQTK